MVLGLLWLGVVASLLAAVQTAGGISAFERFLDGLAPISEVEAWESTFGTIGLIEAGVFIVTGIAWLAWQYQLVGNVVPLGLPATERSARRSVLWWFVPILNFVVVYRIYRELHERLAGGRIGNVLVGAWWGTYLVSGLIAQIAARVWGGMATVDDVNGGIILWMLSNLAHVAAAVVAITLVRRFTSLEAARFAALASRPPTDSASPGSGDAPSDAAVASSAQLAPELGEGTVQRLD